MPKVIFEFNLPDDYHDYEVMNQAGKMKSVLCDFSRQLRSWRKYHHDFKDGDDALDKIREEFYRLLNDHQINIDL